MRGRIHKTRWREDKGRTLPACGARPVGMRLSDDWGSVNCKGCLRQKDSETIEAVTARFWSKVRKTPTCWIWEGARQSDGYGTLASGTRLNKSWRTIKTHRFSFELVNGSIPAGMEVCHHCDNPPCVRPDHLFLGTHQDNVADRDRKKRHWVRDGAGRLPLKSHCRNGHEYTPENTLIRWHESRGANIRHCRECVRAKDARWKAKLVARGAQP